MLITKLVKDWEIITSMLFNFDFANSTILWWFFSFFLLTYTYFIDLYLLISTNIAQIFNTIVELVIPVAKAEIEIHLVMVKAKIRKCSL